MLDLHEGVLGEFAERQRCAMYRERWFHVMCLRLLDKLDREREAHKLRWLRSPGKVREENNAWKARNREHCADYFAAWQKANRERRNAYNRELRARRKVTA